MKLPGIIKLVKACFIINSIYMIKIYIRQFLLLCLVLFAFTNKIKAQEEKFKAIFIYNFTKYINWPSKPGDFIITVLGNDAIVGEIESIATKKTIGNLKIKVITINSPSDIGNCHIIYVSRGNADVLSKVAQKARELNILLITDKQNACSLGADINFINNGGKLTFEISKQNIENCGLQINSALLSLGKAVN
jgi:hypothetical protein